MNSLCGEPGRVRLAVLAGLPGVGKTALACRWADTRRAYSCEADAREELAGLARRTGRHRDRVRAWPTRVLGNLETSIGSAPADRSTAMNRASRALAQGGPGDGTRPSRWARSTVPSRSRVPSLR